ncbi:hypothetical protein CDAR_53911 [Caerostris darwini]|uniref:Uncharacterized protein n=1 Tax=Caerostris darwini TaxID=1538125 RepID=A0AAV4WCN0_9ARAC|nr:hypothetical protein CDAR_53911 [Caerostris darwini]
MSFSEQHPPPPVAYVKSPSPIRNSDLFPLFRPRANIMRDHITSTRTAGMKRSASFSPPRIRSICIPRTLSAEGHSSQAQGHEKYIVSPRQIPTSICLSGDIYARIHKPESGDFRLPFFHIDIKWIRVMLKETQMKNVFQMQMFTKSTFLFLCLIFAE